VAAPFEHRKLQLHVLCHFQDWSFMIEVLEKEINKEDLSCKIPERFEKCLVIEGQ
jgi:hypothetical protein